MQTVKCSECENEWIPLPFVTDKECPRCLHPLEVQPGPVFTEGQKLYGVDAPGIHQRILWRKELSCGSVTEVTYLREHGIVAGERAIWISDGKSERSAHLRHYPYTVRAMAERELYQKQSKLIRELAKWIDALKDHWNEESPTPDPFCIPEVPVCDCCGEKATLTQCNDSRRLLRCVSCVGALREQWSELSK